MNKRLVGLALILFSWATVGMAGRLYVAERSNDAMETSATNLAELSEGMWGGEHIRMDVTKDGVTVEFDCAHGAFDRKPILDKQGGFTVTGTYTAEHGGPVRMDETPRALPVRYLGVVNHGKLQLTIRNSRTKRMIGTFNLTHGAEPMLVKCR